MKQTSTQHMRVITISRPQATVKMRKHYSRASATLAVGNDGMIDEATWRYRIVMKKFNLEWLTDGKDHWSTR